MVQSFWFIRIVDTKDFSEFIFRLELKHNILYFVFHELEIFKDMPAISGWELSESTDRSVMIKDHLFGHIYFYIFINTLDQIG